ncbi:MAG TPA: IS1595 family transposase [Terracidiphilus sp.]|nr:IS1595 family transposase [Terracidiphilus sp.]
MDTPKTLTEAIRFFENQDNCISFLVEQRWPDGKVKCPTCGRDDVSHVPARRVWQCKTRHPKSQFSIKIGTIMEDSALPVDKWLIVMWMLANCKNGVSSYEIQKAVGVTQKSAWHMLHRCRLALRDERTHKFGFGGPVEGDEVYIGPNPQKMHKDRKARIQARDGLKAGFVGKTAVQGILDRHYRQVRVQVLPNLKRETLQGMILDNVTPFAKVYTDEHGGYTGLEKQFVHEVINHSHEYVRGQVHTQGIENFWSLLKRTLRGTYVAVEPFHLHAYLDEQVFRFNNRATRDNPLTDADRFTLAVMQIVGKKLTYAELTGKEAKEPEAN